MKVIRQGDVCLVQVKQFPKDAKPDAPKSDVILAYGEVTGHAHRIREFQKVRVWDAGAERFIQALETVQVSHEEHAPATLEAGTIWRQYHQVEERGEAIRQVAD